VCLHPFFRVALPFSLLCLRLGLRRRTHRRWGRVQRTRSTFRPITSLNNASISSVATLRLRFLRSLAGEDFPASSSSRLSSSLLLGTAATDGVVVFNLVSLADVADAPLDDGVACWWRHSFGLRWRRDSTSPRVKNRAWGEPARRAACGRSARASFS